MFIKIGRNDPCPCGSGKKYKNCCLDKDLPHTSSAIAHEDDDNNSILPIETDFETDNYSEPEVLSYEEQAVQELLDEFQDASFDQKIVLLKKGMLMPDFSFFADIGELYEDIAVEVNSQQDVQNFLKCVDYYQNKNVRADEETEGYILTQAVSLCLKFGQAKQVQEYFLRLAKYADIIPDTFTNICDELAYHGNTSLLKEGYKIGWDHIRDSNGLMGWAIDNFMSRYIDAVLFDNLEKQKSPRFTDPKFQKDVANLDDINLEQLDEYFSVIVQPQNKQWNARDFFIAEKKEIGKSFQKNIWKLCKTT